MKTKLLIAHFGLIPALVMAQANGPVGSPALQGGSQSNQIGGKVRQAGASVVQDMRQDVSSFREGEATNSVSQQLPVAAPQTEASPGFNSGHIQNTVPTGAAYGAVGSGPQPPIPPNSLSPGSPMPASEQPSPPFGVQPSQKVSRPTADGDKDREIPIEDWNH